MAHRLERNDEAAQITALRAAGFCCPSISTAEGVTTYAKRRSRCRGRLGRQSAAWWHPVRSLRVHTPNFAVSVVGGGIRNQYSFVLCGTGLNVARAVHWVRCCHTAVGCAHVSQMGILCSHRRTTANPHCLSVWVVGSAYTPRCEVCTPDCMQTRQSRRCSSGISTKRFTLRPASGQKCSGGPETGPTRQTTMPRSTAYTQSTTRPC